MQLPATVTVGPVEIHLDVLASRMQRHRRGIMAGGISLVILMVGLVSIWVGRPWIMGQGMVMIVPGDMEPDGMQIRIDGRVHGDLGQQVILTTGRHQVEFTAPGYFPAAAVVEVVRDTTHEIVSPALRPRPEVQAIPMLTGATAWTHAVPDVTQGWRLMAEVALAGGTPTPEVGWGTTGIVHDPRMIIHLHDQGMERMLVLETHGVADEIHLETGERVWAGWEPVADTRTADVVGYLRVESPIGSSRIGIQERMTGIWWSPGGTQVVLAAAGSMGESLYLVDTRELHAREERVLADRITTTAGRVVSVQWSPSGREVVVISALQSTSDGGQDAGGADDPDGADEHGTGPSAMAREAILILGADAGNESLVMRLPAPPMRPLNLLPMSWAEDVLYWTSDTGLGLALDTIDLEHGTRTRQGPLDDAVIALTVLPDHGVRTLLQDDTGTVVVETWPERRRLFALDELQVTGEVSGQWVGDRVLVGTRTDLWQITTREEGLR